MRTTQRQQLEVFEMIENTRRSRNFLLVCGILASLLYCGTDILAGVLRVDYSFTSQSASVLSAYGASTRPLVLPLQLTADILLVPFAFGIWRSAGRNRTMRVIAGLLTGNAIISGVAVAFFPMHHGEAVSTLANTINVILMGVGVVLFQLAIVLGVIVYRNWFRFYSLGTILVLLVGDILATLGTTPTLYGNPGPLVGIQERIMIYGDLLWIVVLAIVLLRAEKKLVQQSVQPDTRITSLSPH